MFRQPKSTSGFIEDPFDPRDIWEDELGGEPIELPPEYKIEGLKFQYQGANPYCVAYSVTTAIEHKLREQGKDINEVQKSQPHLFHHSNGGPNGSYFRANLNTARKKGVIPEKDCPPKFSPYGYQHAQYRKEALAVPFDNAQTISAYTRVKNDRRALKEAIIKHGPILVGTAAYGGYWTPYQKRAGSKDTHAALLVGWDYNDNWLIFDSLRPNPSFDGYHWKDKDYGFPWAYAIVDLDKAIEQVKEEVEEKREGEFQHCLDHYGKPQRWEDEHRNALKLKEAFERFNNKSVMDAAGRFWTVYVNAVTYGGYSISYRKWGRWTAGDVINDCYLWRRTGKHIFDFNRLRNTYD